MKKAMVIVAGLACASAAQAALITFTGGNVVRLDASVQTTNNSVVWDNVDYYEEAGFRLDFLPNSAVGFSTLIGNYYAAGNDVIHSHWSTGNFGQVTAVEITKIGGGTFDLNYFTLTSNTEFGGGPASGNEQTYVQGFDAFNVPTGPAVLLPSENWGFPATQIALGSDFDAVTSVRFFANNHVDCFGMDDFYIDQIPSPTGSALLSLGGLLAVSRRRRV